MRIALPRIWLITNPEHPNGPVSPIVRALRDCPHGCVGVQLRAHDVPDRRLVEWGHELRIATWDAGALLTVNRRPDVAEIVEADGLHLPERSLAPEEIRVGFPEISLIGASRHDRPGLQRAAAEGASFAFLSPVFPVPGKGAPMGIERFAEAIVDVAIPTYALGGIEARHVRPLIAAGAFGVAVRRSIYQAPVPAEALKTLLHELDNALGRGE